jgi:hypothetical protein
MMSFATRALHDTVHGGGVSLALSLLPTITLALTGLLLAGNLLLPSPPTSTG